MAIGRISGPLLKEDLLRDEVNLAFETNLLFLDVNTHAADVASNPLDSTLWTGNIGIRNTNPAYPLDVTGTFRATSIKGGLLEIDNINVNGNTITTSVGSLILDAATNFDNVTINKDVLINGNLHATGNITADGSLQLGDANTDNVVFGADINSDIMPNTTDTYILGGTGKRWLRGNFQFLDVGDVYLSGNTVTSSLTNGNLNLTSNGTGSVVINNALTVGPTGAIAMPGNITIGGNLTVVGDIIGGPLRTDDIQIVGNRIETTSSNSNFEINTVGTGSIELLANSNVTGALGVSGTATATNISSTGQVTFATGASGSVASFGTAGNRVWINGGSANNTIYSENNQLQIAPGGLNWATQGALFTSANLDVKYTTTSTSSTSGALTVAGGAGIAENLNVGGTFSANGLSTLGNLQVNGTTTLTGPITASNNVSIAGTLYVTGDIVGGPLRTDDIQIVGNRIETTSSNSNFEINTVGTGSIELLANSNVTGTLGVSGLSTLAQAQITDLTSGRLTYASTSGRLVDSANLTFNGTLLTVTGNETVTGLATLAQAQVSDLTSGRVTFAGTSGRLQDSSALTFSNGTLTVGTSVSVSGTGGDITMTGGNITGVGNVSTVGLTVSNNATISGTLYVTGDIVGGPLRTDDIQIVGNRIETTATNSNFEVNTVGTGSIELLANTNITGNLGVSGNVDVVGNITLGGNIRIGDTTLDTINVVADFTSDLVPDVANTFDLGTSAKPWRVVNAAEFNNGVIRIDDNTITTTVSNANLELNANGVGTIELQKNTNVTGTFTVSSLSTLAQAQVSDLTSGRITYAGASGRLIDSTNLTFDGSTLTITGNETVTGNITSNTLLVNNNATVNGTLYVTGDIVGGPLRTDDIQIVGNRIETTSSNSNFEINTVGTGSIELLANSNVTGTFDVSSQATLASANIEDLTSGRIVLAGTNGELEDSVNLTFNGTTVSVTGNISVTGGTTSTINGITINGTTIDSADSSGIIFTPLVTFNSDASVENNLYVRNKITTNDILVEGNLTVLGTETVINSTSFSITDGLIYLGEDNQSNVIDLGFVASFNDGTYQHTGLVRDATDGKWKLFESVIDEPSLTINFNQATYSTLKLGTLEVDSLLNSNLTAGRVVLAGTNGELEDNANLTFNGTTLTVTGNQHITGDLDVDGNITLGGNIRIGNQDVDTVTVVADFTSDLFPNESNTYDIGRANKAWRVLYASEFDNGVININDNTIKTTVSNSNLEFIANGTGIISIPSSDVTIDQNLIVNNTSTMNVAVVNGTLTANDPSTFNDTVNINGTLTVNGATNFNGNINHTGDMSVSGSLTVVNDITSSSVQTDDIRVDGNVITTTLSNSDLEIRTNGSGTIELQDNTNVTGTFDASGLSTLAQVQVSDLTSGRITYAGTSGRLVDSANLTFSGTNLTVTGNETVTGTATLGSLLVNGFTTLTGPVLANDTLSVSGTLYVTGDIVGGPLRTDDIQIVGNRIETTATNSNFEVNTAGTGSIELLADTNVTGNLNVSGNIDVVGDITLGGNIRIGDTTLDNVTVVADFTSDLIPNASNSYDLGTANKAWRNVYAGQIDVDGIRIDTTTISTVNSNANLELTPSGTGIVYINGTGAIRIPTGNTFQRPVTGEAGFIRFNSQTNNIEAWNGVTFAGISGGSSSDTNGDTLISYETGGNNEDIIRFFTGVAGTTAGSSIGSVEQAQISSTGLNVIRNLTVGNDFTVTGNATISEITTDDVRISGNRISTTQSNSNLELTSNGAGVVSVQDTLSVAEDLTVAGTSTLARANVSDLTDGRITYAGASGRLKDSANLTFNGTTLALTGNQTISGTLTVGGVNVNGAGSFNSVAVTELLVNGRIHIYDNVIENTLTNDDLIIRANGTGRVIIDGAGTSEGSGNIYATDPLLTLNSAKTTSNTYDSGLIIERGTDINVGFIWDESADQFAFISTIEQGTVKGNVAITGYQDLSVGTVKLNSETASKVTFTDASKYVRSLDTGTTAYVDGVIKFNTGAQAAIPTGSTAQRPASPQEGTIRYNTTVQQFEGYADSSWQAMGFGAGTAPSYQGFLANGSQFEFTLNQVPLSSAGIIVAINGVVQEPEIAYTVDNAILRFIDDTSTVVAPDVGDRIDVRFLSKPAVSTVRTSNFVGDDTTTAFDTGYTIASVETVLVFVNSIYQDSDVYTVSGRSVVFDEAPYQDDRVNIVNITTIVAPDLPTKTYVDQQITQVSNTATDDAIAFAIALG